MAEWTTPGLEPRDPPADFGTLMLRDIEALSRQMQQSVLDKP